MTGPQPAGEAPGIGLRRMALTTPPADLGFVADAEFPTVYGVLTEWNVGGDAVTVMSMRDGTASLYTTSSFGIIGGGEHERVRAAAVRYVRAAERFTGSAEPVAAFDYPGAGQVFCYLLTYDGVRRVVGAEDAPGRGSDPARTLFAAAQEVLTELRRTTERGDRGP